MVQKLLATKILLSLSMSGNDMKVASNFCTTFLAASKANSYFVGYLLMHFRTRIGGAIPARDAQSDVHDNDGRNNDIPR